MNDTKPSTISEYRNWLNEKHGVAISRRTENHYQAVVTKVQVDFEKSVIWKRLMASLQRLDHEYLLAQNYHLWTSVPEPVLETKPFDSFFLKTFRKNVTENTRWPEAPEDGWILPSNWHSRINDTVRTLFVVKYLDGVEFAIDKIRSLCASQKTRFYSSLEAREEGYYAAHVYITRRFQVPRETWDTQHLDVSIELHITTQLQDVIRTLLHKYYEERRAKLVDTSTKWQWNYQGDEFVANYLGHILHYVEGMIMDVRKRQEAGAAPSGRAQR